MRIVHFGHSCLLLETGSARLLFDPGTYSAGFEHLTGLDAVLITHQHPDHVDAGKLPALLSANPQAQLVVDPGTAGMLDLPVQIARPGDVLELAGASVHAVGGQHALIHPEIPLVRNTGYIVDGGAFYHPGDALFVPEQAIDVLGLPTDAPWLKSAEAIDFLRLVKPRIAVPIHQGVLATPEIWYRQFTNLAPAGTTVEVLPTDAEPADF